MVKYVYDAWGNHKVYNPDGTVNSSSSFIGNKNPFRYRGYYYDVETKFYYLQSRYYDPEVGRFINIDKIDYADPETLGGLNLYAYCLNNPVMYVDYTGCVAVTASLIGWGIAAFAIFIIGGIERNYHPIQNTVEEIIDAGSDVIDSLSDAIDNQTSDVIINGNDLPATNVDVIVGNVGQTIKNELDIQEALIRNIHIQFSISMVSNPDPYARPGQKKQGRERKNKSRQHPGWEQRNGKRGGPKPLPPHTPGKDHRKYFEIISLLYYIF